MITEKTVQEELWPVVQRLIAATLADDEKAARRELVPNRPVADMLAMFGLTSLDICLKTVLLSVSCALRQAIEPGGHVQQPDFGTIAVIEAFRLGDGVF